MQSSRKCLEKLFGVCGNSASASKNFLAFAGTPQVSRKTFWRLRELRKCLEKLFGVCRNAANASKNFLAFAGTLQMPRKLFGVCSNAASALKNFLVFAGMLQMPRKTFRRLQQHCKCLEKLFGVCRNAANVFGSLTRGFTPPSAARRNTRSGRSRAPSAGCVARAAVAPSGAARRAWRRPRRRPRCRSRAG